jgi:predicted enzyme related to lactoylglutathione lyase
MEKGQVVWFEIPVTDLDRAINFYSNVLFVKVEKIKFLDAEQGFFDMNKNAIKGALTLKENVAANSGIVLFFYVIAISDSLRNVLKYGGQIIKEKTLIKQKNKEGYLTINNNMIDGNVGYYAEIIDSEGNQISLYSNS